MGDFDMLRWGSSPHMRGAHEPQRPLETMPGIIPAHAGSTPWRRSRPSPTRDHPRTCGEHFLPIGPPFSYRRIIPAHAGSTPSRRAASPGGTDHPRTCGEHSQVRSISRALEGSSPHMRGARSMRDRALECCRIIPAHAGSTDLVVLPAGDGPDHPRTCGEHLRYTVLMTPTGGSSPHMRGARQGEVRTANGPRIIPAHAGSTAAQIATDTTDTDHPRTCGEHVAESVRENKDAGSSPHMRGAPHSLLSGYLSLRIIPAHAGSTPRCAASAGPSRDHPRTCGEHRGPSWSRPPRPGSSPHMRGAQDRAPQQEDRPGIIPAHAGSTRSSPTAGRPTRDHPRTCGEHMVKVRVTVDVPGSSPHMRGAQARGRGRRAVGRIIPAHAGSTKIPRPSRRPSRDHPRTCGEHWLGMPARPLITGSSPHMRGAPGAGLGVERHQGIIPAHAGSTPPTRRRR